MTDQEKRRRADFVVPTGLGRNLTLRRLHAVVRLVSGRGSSCCGRSRRVVPPSRGRP
jgi:dephospho-CoA kinase